jgi:hypothetical protein
MTYYSQMPKGPKGYREKLLKARNRVQRQLDILRTGRRTADEPRPIPVAGKLTALLKQIDDALTALGNQNDT